MWKIKANPFNIKRKWSLATALAMIDRWEGTLLYTSPEIEGENQTVLGINPLVSITSEQHSTLEPIDRLKHLYDFPFPWIFGYIGYDSKSMFEEKDVYQNLKDTSFADFSFHIYQYVLLFDQQWQLKNAYEFIVEPENHSHLLIENIEQFQYSCEEAFDVVINQTSQDKETFMQGVERIKDYIRAGDVYQVNLTRKVTCEFSGSKVAAAKALLESNRIEFGVCYKSARGYLISTSPERFFRTTGQKILTSPVKGTLPRNGIHDKNREVLLSDNKNLCELAMITDLLRNDLSKVCKPGSVKVNGFPVLKALHNVFHLFSDIEGDLSTTNFSAIIKALFPGGSITGCPKIRACQIIETLERKGRGPYTGSFGYIAGNNHMDWNILIRTVFIDQQQLSFNVGGGITLLSDALEEFEETRHKARNILQALKVEETF